MLKQIIKDPIIEKAILDDGYFIVKNFVGEKTIQSLKDYYESIRPKDEINKFNFYATTFSKDINLRKEVKNKIVEALTPSIKKFFFDYKHLGGNFILKTPTNKSKLMVHQDTDLIDETQFLPLNIWCPLTDVNVQNGTLHLIPGSHKFYDIIRTPAFDYPYLHFKDDVIKKMLPIEVSKGDAVIFNSGIIHYSPINSSDTERVVADTFISHKDASVRVHHIDTSNPNAQVERIAQEDDFLETFLYFRENVLKRPETGSTIKFFDYEPPKSTIEEFTHLINNYSNYKTFLQVDMKDFRHRTIRR